MIPSPFAKFIDHTLLRPTATVQDIERLCKDAVENSFYSVCVNPCWLPLCQSLLAASSVKLCTVIGFPLGANAAQAKFFETEVALKQGAHEIDCVLNLGFLKSQRLSDVSDEIKKIVGICKSQALVKVIVESGVLSVEELKTAIHIVNESGADFIKTSTGFAAVGATEEAVRLMRQLGRTDLKIKASGGIKTATDFKKYIDLGVHRVGASQSVAILQEMGAAQ